MQHKNNRMIAAIVSFSFVLMACAAAGSKAAAEKPAKTEAVGNTGLKKVTLTQKANERIGLQMLPIREEQTTRKRTVGGSLVAASDSANMLWVRLNLNESDLKQIDLTQPVEVHALKAEKGSQGILAKPDKGPATTDAESDEIFFALEASNAELNAGQPALVDLVLQGGNAKLKVIPHSALLYDTKGQTWVYTNEGELSFVRAKVSVAYIEGDTVYLSDGPSAGTNVVTFGAAELYGTETGVGK